MKHDLWCIQCESRIIENPDTRLCATCSHEKRKAERNALKPAKKPNSIPKRSEKKKKADSEYTKLRKKFLQEYPMCQAGITGVCNNKSEDVHHVSKSSKNYLNTETWLAVCRSHHIMIEAVLSAEERRNRGLLKD